MEGFRNFSSVSWNPHEHMNIIVGDNGSGKSSVLEALCFLCRGKSFRTSHNASVIAHGQQDFVVFGTSSEHRIGIRRSAESFDIKIDSDSVSSLSRLAMLSPLQIIHPADMELLLGSPAERRAYVDWGAFYHNSDFFGCWSSFRRVLKQRNAYLKMPVNSSMLEAIDAEFVEHSVKLNQYRQVFAEDVSDTVVSIAADFLPGYEFDFHLYPGWDAKKGLEQLIRSSLEKDRIQGYTTYGPQRADLRIMVNRQPVQDVLSRGQIKLLLCAMRLAQSTFLEKKSSKECLFFLDDFASELDQGKREKLSDYLFSLRGQVFITAIDEKETEFFQKSPCSVFELKNNLINQR
jgi:DNA replication and repair protein RecF